MNGRIVGGILIASAVVAGGALYYLQVYGYYHDVPAEQGEVLLVSTATGEPEPIGTRDFSGIDAESSPIRYRACFTVADPGSLGASRVRLDDVTPRNGPPWFDCYDAGRIAAQLEAGEAQAYLGQKNVRFGVDRIVVVTSDGHGYAWNDLNNCGDKAYDGTVIGEDCPEPEND